MLAVILHVRFLENKTLPKLLLTLFFSFYLACELHFNSWARKCPECYGNELCPSFQTSEVRLTWCSCFLAIVNPGLTKGVFYGVFSNGSQLVVKRKCGRIKPSRLNNTVDTALTEVTLNTGKVQHVVFCPEIRDVGLLFAQVGGELDNRKLWLDIENSIEPLLLLLFQSESKWPVPRYYGACGDLIVEEYKGWALTKFISSKFEMRASLALGLLRMADLFTFGHPRYRFYFTDYSLDNLVADSEGSVSLVDLDNVIISSKGIGNYSSVQDIHKSQVLDEVSYAFSSDEICRHYISDHNFFSVCKYLLADSNAGLLREIPSDIEGRSNIVYLLNECAEPKTMNNRFSAGLMLKAKLEDVVSHYKRRGVFLPSE